MVKKGKIIRAITPTSKLIAIGNRRLKSTASNLETIEALEKMLTDPERVSGLNLQEATQLLLILRSGMKQDIEIAKLILDKPIPPTELENTDLSRKSMITEDEAMAILREMDGIGFEEAEIVGE